MTDAFARAVIQTQWLAYESMQVVYHAIQPLVLVEHLVFFPMEGAYLSFLCISPDVADSQHISQFSLD